MAACAASENVAAESQPYEARVIVSGAQVQSGPGDNYYATDNLNQGDAVEVYREKTGGWLAIRPPEGSFSWVAARDLILKDSTVAEVAKDDVASRIGSRVNDRHNAAQVRLKKGEAVEILGDEMINGERWYKISPPAGEFRWVQSSLVERAGPIRKGEFSPITADAADPHPVKQASATASVTSTTNATIDSVPPPLLPVSKPTDPAPPATASAPPTTTATANPTSTSAPPAQPAQTQPAQTPAPSTSPQAAATQPPGDLNQDLSAIELRLSRMVAAPTNLWNTERLERDTAALMARAKTQAERDAVRVTQDKIVRFAAIGRRANQNTAGIPGQSPTRLPPTAAIGSTTADGQGQYDAVGILRPVVSRRPGAPQFALVDERGQVVSFVTATPDLNLQPYLGRRIGVVGNRGYIPEFQRTNVTAARVTPLNDRLVR
jgi:uncharacterized protein YgiM (DUF1202 family)